MQIITDQQLIEQIEAFLGRHGMAPTRFGRDVMREPALLKSLKDGRSLSLSRVNKIVSFMNEYDAAQHGSSGKDADVYHIVQAA